MNRSIISALFVILIGIGAVGFYRGWFAISSPSSGEGSGKVNVSLTMDREKIQEDAQTVKNEAAGLAAKVTNPSSEPAAASVPK